MQITEVASLAPSWSFTSLETSQTLVLPPQQSASLVLEASFSPSPSVADADAFVTSKMDALLANTPVGSSLPPQISLLTSSTANAPTDLNAPVLTSVIRSITSSQRITILTSLFTTVKRSQRPYVFPLIEPRSLSLIVFWSSGDRRGFIFMPDMRLGPSENIMADVLKRSRERKGGLYEETQRERDALTARLERSEYAREDCPVVVATQVKTSSFELSEECVSRAGADLTHSGPSTRPSTSVCSTSRSGIRSPSSLASRRMRTQTSCST